MGSSQFLIIEKIKRILFCRQLKDVRTLVFSVKEKAGNLAMLHIRMIMC